MNESKLGMPREVEKCKITISDILKRLHEFENDFSGGIYQNKILTFRYTKQGVLTRVLKSTPIGWEKYSAEIYRYPRYYSPNKMNLEEIYKDLQNIMDYIRFEETDDELAIFYDKIRYTGQECILHKKLKYSGLSIDIDEIVDFLECNVLIHERIPMVVIAGSVSKNYPDNFNKLAIEIESTKAITMSPIKVLDQNIELCERMYRYKINVCDYMVAIAEIENDNNLHFEESTLHDIKYALFKNRSLYIITFKENNIKDIYYVPYRCYKDKTTQKIVSIENDNIFYEELIKLFCKVYK